VRASRPLSAWVVVRFVGAAVQTTQTDLLWAVRDTQNREAWGSFYRIYAPMLEHFSRRLGLPDVDADDVTQEVLMIAHRSLHDGVYDPQKGSFRMFLYGIARRQTLAALRMRRRRTRLQSMVTDEGADLLTQIEDRHNEETVQEIWRQEWRYALLDEALRQVQSELGENVFQAFSLYAIQRRPVSEVAERLGIAPSSVYVYKGRVLEAIRRWVAQFEVP